MFEFPPTIKIIGNKKIKEENTILESRKISDGKMAFASEIVPNLLAEDFKLFQPLFEKLNRLIDLLDSINNM